MTQSAWSSTRRRGFTMAEMVVAVTIMVVVTAVVASLFVQVRKMIGITQWGAETRTQLRTTVNTLADDLRNINDQAYFIMLNRDYQAAALNPGEPTNKILPADRIAFVAQGPFNAMPNSQFGTGATQSITTSARVYYGHSLYTHEWADAVWAGSVVVPPVANELRPPWGQFPAGFDQRPGVNWCFVRQAVVHAEDSSADTATPAQEQGLLRDNSTRLNRDTEFGILYTGPNVAPYPLNLYTWTDLSRWVNQQLVQAAPDSRWLALVWPPQVHLPDPPLRWDPSTAPARLLMPHAAKIRFQVRLSNGTIVPQTDDASPDPRERGQLISQATDGIVTGLNPAYNLAGGTLLDPTTLSSPAGMSPTIQVQQLGYVWTGTRTNVQSNPAPLWPVALRVRIEVYDPEKRTPDPIVVDEWLPVRWQSQPVPAP